MTTSPRFHRFAPIFRVSNLHKALRHYETLGFAVHSYAGGAEYGYAERDGVELHLALTTRPDFDPQAGAGEAYLYVDDADALAAEWLQSGAGGRTHKARNTEYGLREGFHVDEDHNLIRFGSPTVTSESKSTGTG